MKKKIDTNSKIHSVRKEITPFYKKDDGLQNFSNGILIFFVVVGLIISAFIGPVAAHEGGFPLAVLIFILATCVAYPCFLMNTPKYCNYCANKCLLDSTCEVKTSRRFHKNDPIKGPLYEVEITTFNCAIQNENKNCIHFIARNGSGWR